MSDKLKAIITVGVSASGKNTWVDNFVDQEHDRYHYSSGRDGGVWDVIERDVIRFTNIINNNGVKDWGRYKFNKTNENKVTEIQNELIQKAVENERNIIICETNLNSKNRNSMISKLEGLGYVVEIKEFEPPTFSELVKRDANRHGGVGAFVLWRQYKQWLDYKGSWKYTPNNSLPEAVALDMDGSICKMISRGPFDWKRVGEDAPIPVNVDFALGMQQMGYCLIIFSGRDGSCEDETKQWLSDNGIIFDDIYMRKAGDCRKDYIVKEEIIKEAAKKYNIAGVLDDRAQVTRMWNQIGLHCWNVGDPLDDF